MRIIRRWKSAEITVKETLSDKFIFKNGKNRMSENYEKDKYIDPIDRENVKGNGSL